MKKIIVGLVLSFGLAAAQEQAFFIDIPEGAFAEKAVARASELGIVVGFPDGTFRGNEAVTRYQMAIVISRLLDVLEVSIAAQNEEFDAKIRALQTGFDNVLDELLLLRDTSQAVEEALQMRSQSVDAALGRLSSSLQELQRSQEQGEGSLEAALEDIRESVSLLQREQAVLQNELAALQQQSVDAPGERESGAPDVLELPGNSTDVPSAAPVEDLPVPRDSRPFYLVAGAALDLPRLADEGVLRVPVQLGVGYDRLLFDAVGLRIESQLGKQGPINAGSVGFGGYLDYRADLGGLKVDLLAGGGVQLGSETYGGRDGAFASAGTELGLPSLSGAVEPFVSLRADYHFGEGEVYSPLYYTVGLGVKVRP